MIVIVPSRSFGIVNPIRDELEVGFVVENDFSETVCNFDFSVARTEYLSCQCDVASRRDDVFDHERTLCSIKITIDRSVAE